MPVYPASEQGLLHGGHLGAELARLDQTRLQQPQVCLLYTSRCV
ncbi:hypothetical protein [Arthrobacter sp. KBS0703]|nr:hypothetical protein [Arthrobacter sp. KBS0703]